MTGPEPGIPANAHMLSQKGEHGIKVISDMMGEDYGAKLREAATSGKFGSDITRLAIDNSFADSWGREGLSRKENSILIIGILLALKQPSELKNHVTSGAANGITVPGRYMAVGSIEWQRPIRRNGLPTEWEHTLFIDAGSVAERPRDLKPKVGVGTGVRWRSPIGPLQIDVAYGLESKKLRLHMSVGFVF